MQKSNTKMRRICGAARDGCGGFPQVKMLKCGAARDENEMRRSGKKHRKIIFLDLLIKHYIFRFVNNTLYF